MRKRLLKKIANFWLLISAFGFFAVSGHFSLAQSSFNEEANGLKTTGSIAGYTDTLQKITPESLAANLIGLVLSWVGVIFLILTIYGGLIWMTAQGNDQKMEKAKTLIIAAISGLIVVIAAYAISAFVMKSFS